MPLIMNPQSPTPSNSSSDYFPSDHYSEPSSSTASPYYTPHPSVRSHCPEAYASQNKYDDKGCHPYQQYSVERTSTETQTSTTPSIDELDGDLPRFDVPEHRRFNTSSSTAVASTPREFADYFPSTKKLSIKHDDATDDGNMNLRVGTVASTSDGGAVDLTLFHLRMYDLKRREFSLRRYCRDSGKEVCHTSRRYTKPSVIRGPALQRSMSNALSSLRSKSDHKMSPVGVLKRKDSGYDSMSAEEVDENVDTYDNEGTTAPRQLQSARNVQRPSNTILLEFYNYAHLEVRRRGVKSSKKYDFDYWGTKYTWKRAVMRSGSFTEVSYHLVDMDSSRSVAHIVPIPMSNTEARKEEAKGG
ncbi:MAG: hypothetical protein Q9163_004270 [Psora crenata]